MNKKFLIISFFLIYFKLLIAQSGLSPQNINVTTDLYSVFAIDSNNVLITGRDGIVLKTTNGGVDWIQPNSPTTTIPLVDICFTNENKGWIIGGWFSMPNFRLMLETNDGGYNWVEKTINLPHGLLSIFFLNDSIGWAGGYRVMIKTVDGGYTWQELDVSSFYPEIKSISFVNTDIGWIGGEKSIHKTTDGGQTWQSQNPMPGYWIRIYSVQALNTDTLWATGCQVDINNCYKKSFKSIDGGQSWSEMNTHFMLESIYFVNKDTGWGAGSGHIVYSSDGGNSWIDQYTSTTYRLTDISFIDSKIGWVVGGQGTILKTVNGGINWTTLTTDVEKLPSNLPSIFHLDKNYPNPFNPITTIEFFIQQKGFVELSIFNVKGEKIEILVNNELNIGNHKSIFNGSKYPSGLYFYQIKTESYNCTRKMVLLK